MAEQEQSVKFVDATLDTITQGRLKECFERALAEVAIQRAQLDEYQKDKEARVHSQIKIVLDFAMDEDTITVSATCDVTPPKRISVGGPLYQRNKKLVVWENEPREQPLPFKPRAVPGGGGE